MTQLKSFKILVRIRYLRNVTLNQHFGFYGYPQLNLIWQDLNSKMDIILTSVCLWVLLLSMLYLKPFLLYFIGMFKRNQRIKLFCTTWMIFLLAGKQEQCCAVIYFQFFNIHAKKGGWSLSLMKKQLSLQKSWCFSVYNLIPLIWLCGSHRKNFRI